METEFSNSYHETRRNKLNSQKQTKEDEDSIANGTLLDILIPTILTYTG